MSRTLQTRFKERGTRFLIYPQPKRLRGFAAPVPVYVDMPPGTIKAGPEDDALYVVDAVAKVPYKKSRAKPPYTDVRYPSAVPGPGGHFDHIKPTDRRFLSATVYATVRCVMEIWEGYFGRHLPWYLSGAYRRLEIIPVAETDTAYSGDGYLEFGYLTARNPFCENFDMVAHEVGHNIGWAVIGRPERRSMAYRANDEACADLMAIVASLHFDIVVDRLLRQTRGNLFSTNDLARLGELGKTRQARKAFNRVTMATVRNDPNPARYKYNLSLPFTGGGFDILIEIYEQGLITREAIPAALATRSSSARRRDLDAIHREFARHYAKKSARFRSALLDARDHFGRLIARALDKTPMTERSHARVAANMIHADAELSGGRYATLIRKSFQRRGILPTVDG